MNDMTVLRPDEITPVSHKKEVAAYQQKKKATAFSSFQFNKTDATNHVHRYALRMFAAYHNQFFQRYELDGELIVNPYFYDDEFFENPDAWQYINSAKLDAFLVWMDKEGYSIQTMRQNFSAIKIYAKLAHYKAGTMDKDIYLLIKGLDFIVSGEDEAINHDVNRESKGIPTRRQGAKKAEATKISHKQVKILYNSFSPHEASGRRNRMIICLLAYTGIRVSELCGLRVEDVDLDAGTIRVYRKKTKRWEILTLRINRISGPDDTLYEAVKDYMEKDSFETGILLRKSTKAGYLGRPGIRRDSMQKLILIWGKNILGIEPLGPHDFRHYFARSCKEASTREATMKAGSWKTEKMLETYQGKQDPNEIVNAEVILED